MATEVPGRVAGERGLFRLTEPADLIRFRLDTPARTLRLDAVLVAGEEIPA
jgi:hypothetical protein